MILEKLLWKIILIILTAGQKFIKVKHLKISFLSKKLNKYAFKNLENYAYMYIYITMHMKQL